MRPVTLACLPAAICTAALLLITVLGRGSSAQEPARGQGEIDELIAQLGSDQFEVREAATRRLSEREDALPALRLARKSRDAEVRRRAGELLDLFVQREKERAFATFADLAKNGAVDQAVERLVRRDKWDDETACWQVMAELAGKLTDLEQQAYGKASLPSSEHVPARDFRRFVARHARELKFVTIPHPSVDDLRPTLKSVYWAVRAQEIPKGPPSLSGLFISSGTVEGWSLFGSVIFAGGSVSLGRSTRSLVVCDGDFTARGDISDSLIIARGKVRCPITVRNSRIISCQDIQGTDPKRVFDSKLVEKEPKPLGFVKFFDPADVGIKVEVEQNAVRVKEATKGKRFAAAGLRADDVVMALNGDEVKDVDGFRRLLRAKIAVDAEVILKVKRGEKTLEVHVSPKG